MSEKIAKLIWKTIGFNIYLFFNKNYKNMLEEAEI